MFKAASLILLTLASSAVATVYTTSPVATTTFTGGQEATVSWQDDGKKPTLEEFGNALVSVYVGNAQQQTFLQRISESVNVATETSVKFTVDASIGPDSEEYFVRFESIGLKDAAAPQFPALAFSAKFKMTGMSGTFNSTTQAQIDGQATAPLAGQTAKPSGTAAATGNNLQASTTGNATKPTGSSSGTAKPTGSAAASSAVGVKASLAGVLFAAAAGFVAL